MLRLVLAVSLDGRLAPATGGAAQLGGAADRRVLEEALAWADGALIGAETLRLHGGTCLIHAPDLLAERRRRGLPPQPAALVVSRSGRLPAELPFWRQPLQRWLLGPAPPPGAAGAFHRRLPLEGWPELLQALAAEGLERLALLGGATLAGALLAADRVDELQLSLCPLLLGGPHSWVPPGLALPTPTRWRLLEQRPLDGGELLLRYGRAAAPQQQGDQQGAGRAGHRAG